MSQYALVVWFVLIVKGTACRLCYVSRPPCRTRWSKGNSVDRISFTEPEVFVETRLWGNLPGQMPLPRFLSLFGGFQVGVTGLGLINHATLEHKSMYSVLSSIHMQESTHKVPKPASQAALSRMQLTLHATRQTPHGESRLV